MQDHRLSQSAVLLSVEMWHGVRPAQLGQDLPRASGTETTTGEMRGSHFISPSATWTREQEGKTMEKEPARLS